MANVKMTFTVEIDGEILIQHQIEEHAEKRSYFSQERKLTKDIINKMNEFHSERWVDTKPWTDLQKNNKAEKPALVCSSTSDGDIADFN